MPAVDFYLRIPGTCSYSDPLAADRNACLPCYTEVTVYLSYQIGYIVNHYGIDLLAISS